MVVTGPEIHKSLYLYVGVRLIITVERDTLNKEYEYQIVRMSGSYTYV